MISIREFQITMWLLGAKRLEDKKGSRYDIPVPCFEVADIHFLHSGSYYIVQRKGKVPKEIREKAMTECDEKYPGGQNFWHDEIHSVKGLCTIVLMLQNRYDKQTAKEFTSEVYRIFFEKPWLSYNRKRFCKGAKDTLTRELHYMILEFHDITNPFGCLEFKKKQPIEYVDKINISFGGDDPTEGDTYFRLFSDSVTIRYNIEQNLVTRSIEFYNDVENKDKGGYTVVSYYYNTGKDSTPIDEVIRLDYKAATGYEKHDEDIKIRISIKTGLAWGKNGEENAKPVTKQQIRTMINHLEEAIEKAKVTIIDKMIENDE